MKKSLGRMRSKFAEHHLISLIFKEIEKPEGHQDYIPFDIFTSKIHSTIFAYTRLKNERIKLPHAFLFF